MKKNFSLEKNILINVNVLYCLKVGKSQHDFFKNSIIPVFKLVYYYLKKSFYYSCRYCYTQVSFSKEMLRNVIILCFISFDKLTVVETLFYTHFRFLLLGKHFILLLISRNKSCVHVLPISQNKYTYFPFSTGERLLALGCGLQSEIIAPVERSLSDSVFKTYF